MRKVELEMEGREGRMFPEGSQKWNAFIQPVTISVVRQSFW
jgi:hypothetical protein